MTNRKASRKTRKATVFWTIHFTLTVFLLGLFCFYPDLLIALAPAIITGIVANATQYAVTNVADNTQRSVSYNTNLDTSNHENRG